MQITFQLTIDPSHRHSAVQPASNTGRSILAQALAEPAAPPKGVTHKTLKAALERLAQGTRALTNVQRFTERLSAIEQSLEGLQARLSDLFPSGDELLIDHDRDDRAQPAQESPFAQAFRRGETDPC